MRVIRLLTALMLFAASALAQDCAADGTVVNSVTGAPVARARVALTDGAGGSHVAQTDETGAWSFNHLACGSLTIDASRLNFLAEKPGQPQTVLMTADVPLHDVKLRLAPQAVITGRVLDDQGDPVQNAGIMVMASSVTGGVRRFLGRTAASANDIGEYRIAGLPAGRYVVCASGPRNTKTPDPKAYGQQCSPVSPDAGAAGTLDIRAGTETAIDFRMTPLPLSLSHVRGFISGGPDSGARQITLSGLSGISSAAIFADGTFEVADVAPGSYFLTATAFQEDTRYFASLPVEVGNADVVGLQVHMEAGLNVAGTVKVESASGTKVENPQYSASLGSSTRTVWADDNASFTLTNVMSGSYQLHFTAPAPFYVKRATLGGRDILMAEVSIGPGAGTIEVVLSDDCGVLQGDVSTDGGPASASILLQRDGTQPRNARADATGRFKIEGLPPGDYKAYAWDDMTNVEYGNPEWMRLHAKGVSVTIQPGETSQVKLTRQTAPDE